MKKYALIILGLLLTWTASSAQAHMMWFTSSNYSPEKGETVRLEIGWGHAYPSDERVKDERLEKVYAVSPDGSQISLEKISPAVYKFSPKAPGAYRIIAELIPGFVSITTDGKKLGNKKSLSNVVSCFAYRISAQSIITVGAENADVARSPQSPFEIQVLKDPSGMEIGDDFPVKIMFQGKPLPDAALKAACGSCEADKDHPWSQEVKSGGDGVARINLTRKGPWMFMAKHKTPYADTDACDEYSYCTTMSVGF